MIVHGHWIPEATGDPAPAWPLASGRRRITTDFGKPRAEGARVHVAEDLPAPQGTIVVAPEAGEIVAIHGFTSPPKFRATTKAILLQTRTGPVLVLAEVEPDSWQEFGVGVGSTVQKGQPVARVGGLGMLHFEAYTQGTRQTSRWYVADPPPPNLLDPTAYLVRALEGPTQPPPGPRPAPIFPSKPAPKPPAPSISPPPTLTPRPLPPFPETLPPVEPAPMPAPRAEVPRPAAPTLSPGPGAALVLLGLVVAYLAMD